MRITLFGATGKTGPYLISEGLKRGFEITVFARSGSVFNDPRVLVVRGDFTDGDQLRYAVKGSDAVLSALGPTKFPHPNDLPITAATESVISAMKQEGVRRLIAVSTGTAPDPGDRFDFKIWLPAVLIKLAASAVYNDILALASAIRGSSLDWTMVRSAVLKDRPASVPINVGLYGRTKHSMTVSREDLARFMFDQAQSPNYVAAAPGISSA
jgi:nucleoside-diphosphate-sugar epimerase